jgi:hypothetical protein
MADEAHETSNSVLAHREPPPSLGMVAHIWAGHLGPVDADADPDVAANPPLDAGMIEVPSPHAPG